MAFQDYSDSPEDNTALGDGTYIGPNMLRTKVRPALQQLAADGKVLFDYVTSALTGIDTGSVADLTLRPDLATTNGAALIGVAGGGTVADATFAKGPVAATTATSAAINWKKEAAAPTHPLTSLAGLWPSEKVYWSHAISAEFDAVNTPVTTPFASPSSAFVAVAQNKGSNTTVCSLQTLCGVQSSSKEASGVNFITYSGAGLSDVKMKGLEVDIQPHTSTSVAEAFGIAINAFTKEIPGDAIYIEGVFGGSWTSGIRVGKLNASIGAGIYGGPGGEMASLVDTAFATYSGPAIHVRNTHTIQWDAASGNPLRIYVDATNAGTLGLPANGLTLKSGTTSLLAFDPSGNIDMQSGAGTIKLAGSLSSTSATGGAATALPAQPVGYFTINVGGVNRKVPYYA